MEGQVQKLVEKTWALHKDAPSSKRLLIAVSGIPGSGKTTLATTVAGRLNALHSPSTSAAISNIHPSTQPLAVVIPMDGYHFSRAYLSSLPDPAHAHARRGAAFTFDADAFLALVTKLKQPILPETGTIYAPSFDHAKKDPVEDDVPIPASARILLFEGNYLSLNKQPWKETAALMDELWFVDVDFETARRRLVKRHVEAGIAADQEAALRRVIENDEVNGREIVDGKVDGVTEVVVSIEDSLWKAGGEETREGGGVLYG